MNNAWAAPSAAPPSALRMWTDSRRIYAELPGSPPYVVWFYKHEGGLAKALALLRQTETAGPAYPGPAAVIDSPAARILREMGVI